MAAELAPSLQRWSRGFLRRVPCGRDGCARIGARQIYILPTSTGLWYAAAVMLMLIGSLNYQNNLGLLFAFFLTGVGIAAMHHCWFNLLGLTVTVRGGAPVFAGDTATFEIALRNEAARSRYDLRVKGSTETLRTVALEGREQRGLPCARWTLRRGWLRLDEVTLETRHPMHLFRAWCYVSTPATVLVYPKPAGNAPPLLASDGGPSSTGLQGGDGRDDYLGPRPYRAGDSPRHVDWKALARERGLIVKQFGTEGGRDLWIAWERLAAVDPEERIRQAARQVLDAAAAGRRFGLRLPGVEVPLGDDEGHCQACLMALALWKPDGWTDTTGRSVVGRGGLRNGRAQG